MKSKLLLSAILLFTILGCDGHLQTFQVHVAKKNMTDHLESNDVVTGNFGKDIEYVMKIIHHVATKNEIQAQSLSEEARKDDVLAIYRKCYEPEVCLQLFVINVPESESIIIKLFDWPNLGRSALSKKIEAEIRSACFED